MENLIFTNIKKQLSFDKTKWHLGIGLFETMLETNEELKEENEKKGKGFRIGKFHAVIDFMRILKRIEHKKIGNHIFIKWTDKLEELL